MTRFLEFRHGVNIYEFECDHCKIFGEIEVKPNSQRIFSHQCGSPIVYMQRQPKSLFEKPRLEEIVVQRGARA